MRKLILSGFDFSTKAAVREGARERLFFYRIFVVGGLDYRGGNALKKNRPHGSLRDAKDALVRLQSNIFLSAFSREDVRGYMSTFLRHSAEHEVRRRLPGLLSKQKISASICVIRRDGARLLDADKFRIDEPRLAILYKAVLESHKDVLKDFYSKAEIFEISLLYGNYDQALGLLDEIFELSGYSFWLIRSRMLVLAKAGRLEEMNKYCEECKARSIEGFPSFLYNCFMLLATNPLLHSRRVIQSSIDELGATGAYQWADLLALMLAPSPASRPPGQLSCFSVLQLFPLVDQAVLIEQLAANNFANGDLAEHIKDINTDLAALKPPEESGPQLDRLAREYERENYAAVFAAIENPGVLAAKPLVQSANLAAKSLAISSGASLGGLRGTIKELVSALKGLYSLDASPRRHLDSIRSIALQMQHLSAGSNLALLLYQVLPNQCEPEERRFAAARAAYLDPRPSNWLAALTKATDPLIDHDYQLTDSEIPQHRKIKREIRHFCKKGDLSSVLERLAAYGRCTPLPRDYFEIASSTLVSLDDLSSLIAICGSALAERQSAYSAFPLRMLVEFIESNSMSDVDSLLVVNAYVRNVSTSKDYLLNETFEAFLEENGVGMPSQLVTEQLGADKVNVVLKDICSLDNLDFLSVYESSSDVRAERIRILDRLLSLSGIKPEQHREEVEDILLQALVDNAATEISVQKVDVNDQELRRRLLDDVSSLFHLNKSSGDSSDRDFIRVDAGDDADLRKAALVGDRNTTLQKLYSVVRDAFLFDEKHGLDKSLSAEVRHGFFSNLMRSKLDARNLLTEKDEEGKFKVNVYWREVNGILVDEVLHDLDEHLRWFSTEFNLLLTRAEEWMKVTINPDSDRVFQYAMYGDLFIPMKEFADSVSEPERILDHILDFLWCRTEECLSRIRDLLDGRFRDDVDNLFEGLIQRIERTRGEISLADLLGAIRLARNEVREDISIVKEWFKRSEALSGKARTLRDLVAISIECYSRVRRIQVKLAFEKGDGLIGISLQGKESKALVVSLMNLYENAITHSGFGTQTQVSLSARSLPANGWELAVINPVTSDVESRLSSGGLEAVQRRLSDPCFERLVLIEGGGTGLRKVMNQLADVSEKCGLTIKSEGRDFIASFNYAC